MKEWGKRERYEKSVVELVSLIDDDTDDIAKMATVSSILKMNLPHYYWSGFYRLVGGKLIIGPYQGTVGCLEIALGRGVCGTAAEERRTITVKDVHEFPGHIACDPRSKSEIVVPIEDHQGNLIGVFDADSEAVGAFDKIDAFYLKRIMGGFFGRAP